MPKHRKTNIREVKNDTSFKQMLKDLRGSVSFDIETTGLYPWAKKNLEALPKKWKKKPPDPRSYEARITSIGFGCEDVQWVWDPLDYEPTKERLAKVQERLERCVVIGQFAKFDLLWMKVLYKVDWEVDFDTGIAHYMIDENTLHGLKDIAPRFLNVPNWDVDIETKKGQKSKKDLIQYQAYDLRYTRDLYPIFKAELRKDPAVRTVFKKIMMPCIKIFVDAEYEGSCIDLDRMDDVEYELRRRIRVAEKKLNKWIPTSKEGSFNWASPKQVGWLLYQKMKIKCPGVTKTGANSTSESTLKQIDHPLVKDLFDLRGARQQLSFFIEGWKPYLHGFRIHPSFKLTGTVTGRLCLRSGTKIQVPSGTKKIEEIEGGDWVYSYDNKKKLCLRKVRWAGVSGEKSLYRVSWSGTGGRTKGHLDATNNHPVRLTSGKYRRVDQLKKGDRVIALHRASDSRNYLYATGNPTKIRENRFVFEQVYGWTPEDVHHKDLNSLNDRPENLEGLTRSKHHSLHAKLVPSSEMSRRAYARTPETKKRNADAVSKAGKLKAKSRFTKKQIIDALEKTGGVLGAKQLLGCSYEALRRRIDEYGLTQYRRNNHVITGVKKLPGTHIVYDIEVEETHNFIANELCVHNSCEHPNWQQVPRDKFIRTLLIAPPGWVLIEADLSQIELRIAAELSGDRALIEAFVTGKDPHWITALRELQRGMGEKERILKTTNKLSNKLIAEYDEAIEYLLLRGADAAIEVDDTWKELRKKAKAVNFGFLYGMWWKKFKIYARDKYDVHLTDEQAQESRKNFFNTWRDLEDWHKRAKRFARRNGYMRYLSGRKRRLPGAQLGGESFEKGEAERQAVNSPVQGFANEVNLMALIQLRKEFPHSIYRPIATVHDSILAYAKIEHVEKICKRTLEIMRRPALMDELEIEMRVPIEADIKIGPWGAGISLKKWKEANDNGNKKQPRQVRLLRSRAA